MQMPLSTRRHRTTAAACSSVSPSSVSTLRLNKAYRYWHMIMCSSCDASVKRYHKCSRLSTTRTGSAIGAPDAEIEQTIRPSWGAPGGLSRRRSSALDSTAGLARADHVECLRDAALAGVFALGLGDPPGELLAVRECEGVEAFLHLRFCGQRGGEILGHVDLARFGVERQRDIDLV